MAYQKNIHRFRSVAIIGIVLAHSLHGFTWAEDDLRFRVLNTLANESSIWFFAIAGFLFQHLSGRFEYRGYLAKKAKNVLVPYLIISIPALIGSLAFYDQGMVAGFDDQPLITQIFLFLVTGKHLAPLWFVPTIGLIFLITPLLLQADRARWPYLLLIGLLPLSLWLGREGLLLHTGLNGNWSSLSKAVYLLPVFLFGMACCRYEAKLMVLVAKWKWALLAATSAVFANVVMTSNFTHIHGLFAFKILCVPLFLYALQSPKATILDRLSVLGHTSFGIFFIHCYFLVALRLARTASGLPERLPGDFISVIALTSATLVLSLVSIYLLQLCFGKACQLIVGCTMPPPSARPSATPSPQPATAKPIVAAR
jgi:surface polysaccharide O-acyltransferase-like enzyme